MIKTPPLRTPIVFDSQMLDLWAAWFNLVYKSLRRSEQIEASFYVPLNSSLVDSTFFVASDHYRVTAARCKFSTAGTDAADVTAQIRKATGTQAPAAGTALLASGFNLKGTANTTQEGTLSTTAADLEVNNGNSLAVIFSGVLTDVAGLVITVTLRAV